LNFIVLHEFFESVHISLFEHFLLGVSLAINSEPFVIKGFLSCQPFLGLGNELLDEVSSFFGNLFPLLSVEVEFSLLDCPKNLLIIVSIEWWVTTKENVKDTTSRSEIARFVVVSGKDLRGDIVWCTSPCLHSLDLTSVLGVADFREPKINDLDIRAVLA